MRSRYRLIVLAAGAALFAGCSPSGPASADADPGTPQGTFLIVGLERSGMKVCSDDIHAEPADRRIVTIENGRLTAMNGQRKSTLRVTFDPARTPPHITATGKDASGKATTIYGIYGYDGVMLVLCLVPDGRGEEDRPRELKSDWAGRAILMTLEKQ